MLQGGPVNIEGLQFEVSDFGCTGLNLGHIAAGVGVERVPTDAGGADRAGNAGVATTNDAARLASVRAEVVACVAEQTGGRILAH